jgi:hypothetical protein
MGRLLAPLLRPMLGGRRYGRCGKEEERVNEPLFHSAADVADMLRRKDISSRELTEMLLARIDAVNPA